MRSHLLVLFLVWGQLMKSTQVTPLKRPIRIVGGEPVEDGEDLEHVSLQDSSGTHFCGGTLVRKNWVLTAAHCTYDIKYKYMRVAVGSNNLLKFKQYFSIKAVFRHENYDDTTLENDIALYKLKMDSDTEHRGMPIALDPWPKRISGECRVIGFGKLTEDGISPNELRSATIPIRTLEFCRKVYEPHYNISDSNLCAGGFRADACQGDSGGPLICCPVMGSPCVISGVTSWGVGCATKGLPGVYTRVAYYLDWIEKIIANN